MVGLAAGGRRRPHYRHPSHRASHRSPHFSFAFYCYALCRERLAPPGPLCAWHYMVRWTPDDALACRSALSDRGQPSSTEHVYLLRSVFGYFHFYGNVLLAGIIFLMLLCVHDAMSDWQAGNRVGSCREHETLLQIRFMKNKKKNVILLMTSSFVRSSTDI